ncbi:MAG: hypothetical protein IKH57_13340 [Clostridia bacterium]|nr:hypothetical protein [Clostridia bacterium]
MSQSNEGRHHTTTEPSHASCGEVKKIAGISGHNRRDADAMNSQASAPPGRHLSLFVEQKSVQQSHARDDIVHHHQMPHQLPVLEHGIEDHEMDDKHGQQRRNDGGIHKHGSKRRGDFLFFPWNQPNKSIQEIHPRHDVGNLREHVWEMLS